MLGKDGHVCDAFYGAVVFGIMTTIEYYGKKYI